MIIVSEGKQEKQTAESNNVIQDFVNSISSMQQGRMLSIPWPQGQKLTHHRLTHTQKVIVILRFMPVWTCHMISLIQ